jgi:hypothetical protein
MKRLIASLAIAAYALGAAATTLSPVPLLNPAGSSSGQVIVSTGASSAPSWGSTLGATSFNGTVTNNTAGTAVSIGGSTPVSGSPGTFFYPAYFGNAGTGVGAKYNRLLVGTEALGSFDVVAGNHQTTQSWVNTWLPSAMAFASIGVTSQIGGDAIVAAARTSDYRAWIGGASGGAGSYLFALNDDLGSGNPIACGACGVAMRASGNTGITLNQFDVDNFGAVVDSTPYGGVVGGATYGIGITAGAYFNTLHNATAAIYIGNGQNAVFRKGIQFFAGATLGGLDMSVGAGGGGVAIEMGTGQTLRWLDNTNATKAEMWGSATGLNISPGIVGTGSATTPATGLIGELKSNFTGPVSLTSGTSANCASVSLGAGDWDVWGSILFTPAGTTTIAGLSGGTNTTSATLPGAPAYSLIAATLTTGQNQVINVPTWPRQLASTTTVYLVGNATFGTSTMTCSGEIWARRRS